MVKPKLLLEQAVHRDQNVILLKFERNQELITLVKQIPSVAWSQSKKCWYIPQSHFNLNLVFTNLKDTAYVDYAGIKRINSSISADKRQTEYQITTDTPNINLKAFRIWLHHKRYSENSIRSYSDLVKTFLEHVSPKSVEELTNDDVVDYVYRHIVGKGYSFSHQNQVVSALKLFFREVVKSKIEIDKLQRPRREHKLPNVLSKGEVKRILTAPKNIKHRTMLSLIYACGLRRSELLGLKPSNIDSKRGLLIVRQSKGNKDRVIPLSAKTIEMLRDYYKLYKPQEWLFEGQIKGQQYSGESLQGVLKQALEAAGITKPVTLHWLRHSYATHLLESGTDLRYIQELLGHRNSKTTEIYTHVSTHSIQKIKSPFDDL